MARHLWRNDRDDDVVAFLREIVALMEKYDLALGHEDSQGGFLVRRGYDQKWADWVMQAAQELP